jgi:hypothetical protein
LSSGNSFGSSSFLLPQQRRHRLIFMVQFDFEKAEKQRPSSPPEIISSLLLGVCNLPDQLSSLKPVIYNLCQSPFLLVPSALCQIEKEC